MKSFLYNDLQISTVHVEFFAEYFGPIYIELLKLLIESGSKINQRDDRNCTPLEKYILLSNSG